MHGRLQRAGDVVHVLAEKFIDLSDELALLREEGGLESETLAAARVAPSNLLSLKSRDFH